MADKKRRMSNTKKGNNLKRPAGIITAGLFFDNSLLLKGAIVL
jgi:hypothetical protein